MLKRVRWRQPLAAPVLCATDGVRDQGTGITVKLWVLACSICPGEKSCLFDG